MWKTKICDLLGIQYPIFEGGMSVPGNAELAAAVSNAGGLGMVGFNPGAMLPENQVENLRNHIRKAKSLTNKTLGVNIPMPAGAVGKIQQRGRVEESIDVAIEEKVNVIVTSGGDPTKFTQHIKDHGLKVLHVVMDERQAAKAEAAGVDAVIASGVDAGGLLSALELPTFVIVPLVVNTVKIPVVAAGGIADARGFVAALSLGAQAVQMGTRFLATKECHCHENIKNAITHAGGRDTIVCCRNAHVRRRSIRGAVSEKLQEMDRKGATNEEIMAFLGFGRDRAGMINGDLVNGEAGVGADACIIRDIPPAGEVVTRIIREADEIIARINALRQA